MNKTQVEANATLYARAIETLAGRLNMGIRDFDAAYGGMNVVGESLLDDSVLNQVLASTPPRGWVHSTNPQDAADLWNGNNKAEAVFWNTGNTRLEEQFPEMAGYSVSVNQSAIEHIKNNHSNAESEARRGQTAITAEAISRITDIVSNYDAIASEPIKGTNNRCFAFAKQFDDGLIVYLADSSKKRRDLRTVSMWKYPQSANAQDVLQHAVSLSNLTPEAEGGISHNPNSTPNTDTNQDILFQGGADRGMFSREHNLIALLKNADASTCVHELRHFFLETNPHRPRPDRQTYREPDRAGAAIPVRRSDDLGLVRRERPCRMGHDENERAARESREMGARF